MTRKIEVKEINISNIWLCAFLTYEGIKPVKTFNDGERISFVFQDTADIQQKISHFLSDRVTVPPNKFISHYQYLRNLIYKNKNKGVQQ